MEILMSDDKLRNVAHAIAGLPPEEVSIPGLQPVLYPRLLHSCVESSGANLRFQGVGAGEKVRSDPLPGRPAQMRAKSVLLASVLGIRVCAQTRALKKGERKPASLDQRRPARTCTNQKDDFIYPSTRLVNARDVYSPQANAQMAIERHNRHIWDAIA
jgi:hypothetical protein